MASIPLIVLSPKKTHKTANTLCCGPSIFYNRKRIHTYCEDIFLVKSLNNLKTADYFFPTCNFFFNFPCTLICVNLSKVHKPHLIDYNLSVITSSIISKGLQRVIQYKAWFLSPDKRQFLRLANPLRKNIPWAPPTPEPSSLVTWWYLIVYLLIVAINQAPVPNKCLYRFP